MVTQGLNNAIFGSDLVSAYWNGAETYYRERSASWLVTRDRCATPRHPAAVDA